MTTTNLFIHIGLVCVAAFSIYKVFKTKQINNSLVEGNKKLNAELLSHNQAHKDLQERFEKQLTEIKEAHDENTFTQKNVIFSLQKENKDLNKALMNSQEKSTKIESQKKSSEVKLGKMAENFMPFIRDYPYDHKQFRFLANPVDGIQVTEEALIFVEFKTGGARLSKSQKHIKDLVSRGKVRFETFRVSESGSYLKLESNMEDCQKN